MDNTDSQEQYLFNILHLAEERTTPPPLPPEGIPRQRLPKAIQKICRLIVFPFIILDEVVQAIAGQIVKTPLKKTGQCKRRGNCCYYILLPVRKGLLYKFYFFWQTQINGFFVRNTTSSDNNGNKLFVMGCRYLQADGKCGSYRLRPSLCRRWPIINIFGHPKILKGCGFSLTLRKSFKKEPYLTFYENILDKQ